MENIKIRSAGRPKLQIDIIKRDIEIPKYLNREQSAIQTYRNMGISKSSFYRLLNQMEVQR